MLGGRYNLILWIPRPGSAVDVSVKTNFTACCIFQILLCRESEHKPENTYPHLPAISVLLDMWVHRAKVQNSDMFVKGLVYKAIMIEEEMWAFVMIQVLTFLPGPLLNAVFIKCSYHSCEFRMLIFFLKMKNTEVQRGSLTCPKWRTLCGRVRIWAPTCASLLQGKGFSSCEAWESKTVEEVELSQGLLLPFSVETLEGF